MASCNQCGNHSVGDAIAAIRAIADAAPVQAVADAVRNPDSGGTMMRPEDLPSTIAVKVSARRAVPWLNDDVHRVEHELPALNRMYSLQEHDGIVYVLSKNSQPISEQHKSTKPAKTGDADADMLFGPAKFAATEAMARAQRDYWAKRAS